MRKVKIKKLAAKKLLRKPKGKLMPIDLSKVEHPDWMTRAFKNNRYVVMIDDNAKMTNGITAIKAMVQRHDDKPIPSHWKEMQNIKNEIFGNQKTAIEYYPATDNLTDIANIYWLWILPDGKLPLPI